MRMRLRKSVTVDADREREPLVSRRVAFRTDDVPATSMDAYGDYSLAIGQCRTTRSGATKGELRGIDSLCRA